MKRLEVIKKLTAVELNDAQKTFQPIEFFSHFYSVFYVCNLRRIAGKTFHHPTQPAKPTELPTAVFRGVTLLVLVSEANGVL